jgi:hypothetical protein
LHTSFCPHPSVNNTNITLSDSLKKNQNLLQHTSPSATCYSCLKLSAHDFVW